MQTAAALIVTLDSACALNVGYLIEHSVASRLPPLSAGRPLRSARMLLSQRRWLAGFATTAAHHRLDEEPVEDLARKAALRLVLEVEVDVCAPVRRLEPVAAPSPLRHRRLSAVARAATASGSNRSP